MDVIAFDTYCGEGTVDEGFDFLTCSLAFDGFDSSATRLTSSGDLGARLELCDESFLGRPLLRAGVESTFEATGGGVLIGCNFAFPFEPKGLPLPLA